MEVLQLDSEFKNRTVSIYFLLNFYLCLMQSHGMETRRLTSLILSSDCGSRQHVVNHLIFCWVVSASGTNKLWFQNRVLPSVFDMNSKHCDTSWVKQIIYPMANFDHTISIIIVYWWTDDDWTPIEYFLLSPIDTVSVKCREIGLVS